jgi:hypothetical protein
VLTPSSFAVIVKGIAQTRRGSGEKEERPMSEENKAQVGRLLKEGFSQGHSEVVDEVLNPDFVC